MGADLYTETSGRAIDPTFGYAMLSMLALVALVCTLIVGVRFSGALLAGTFLSYQVGALLSTNIASAAYAVAASGIVLGKFALRPHRLSPSKTDLMLACFLVTVVASLLWSADFNRSEGMVVALLASATSMFLIGRFISPRKTERLLRDYVRTMIFAGGIIALCLLKGRATGTWESDQRLVLESGEGSAVGLAQPFPFILLSCTVALLLEQTWKMKGVALFVLALCAYTAIASGTRSVFLASLIGCSVFVALCFPRLKSMKNIAIIAGLLAGGLLVLPFVSAQSLYEPIARLTGNISGSSISLDRSSADRLYLFQTAISLFYAHPFIGSGYGSFGYFAFLDYPHNMTLDIAYSLGLLGLIVVGLWFASAIQDIVIVWKENNVSGAVLASTLIISFVQMQVSYPLHAAKPLFLFIPLATSLAFASRPGMSARRVYKRFRAPSGLLLPAGYATTPSSR